MPYDSSHALDDEQIAAILGPEGALSRALKGYESRPPQLEMALCIAHAYAHDAVALIEAGTGIGKSVAYLVPALLAAAAYKERTLISTHTISLQEQLIHKDLPGLIRAMNVEVKAVLVKGMNNYICLRKLADAAEERLMLQESERGEIDQIQDFAQKATEGSKSELPFLPAHSVWERVGAEGDACSHAQCPHYKSCFFFKARKEAADAQILVVNHHLLCADLLSRQEAQGSEQAGILPSYRRVVVDEAHHMEEVATEYFAARVSYLDLLHQLGKLGGERRSARQIGKLNVLRQKLVESVLMPDDPEIQSLLARLEIDLPGEKHQLQLLAKSAFDAVALFLSEGPLAKESGEEGGQEMKIRLRQDLTARPYWKEEVAARLQLLVEGLTHYAQLLQSLESDLKFLQNAHFQDKSRSVRLDLAALAQRLQSYALTLASFLVEEDPLKVVRWIEAKPLRNFWNIHLVAAALDVSSMLHDHLFASFSTVVLCSATLATHKQFGFIAKRLGIDRLEGRLVLERIYESPFDYAKQALLVVPKDMPNPAQRHYAQAAALQIQKVIEACKGQAFVLFTSFNMMRDCHHRLKDSLEQFPVMMQGEEPRQMLLERFKATPHSVLFGTDSFWEGVDVAGEALRCVVIAKLPFHVPSEPLVQARTEAIEACGGDPFMEYTVPHAIVKFKQGFGRLIRNTKDFGCVVCLDPRLMTKGYGRLFLDSLPACEKLFDLSESLHEKMAQFYRRQSSCQRKADRN